MKKLGTEGKGSLLLVLLFIGWFLFVNWQIGHHLISSNLKEGEKNSTKLKLHADKYLLSRLKKNNSNTWIKEKITSKKVFIMPPFSISSIRFHVDRAIFLKHLYRKLLKESLHKTVRKCNTVHLFSFFKYQDHSWTPNSAIFFKNMGCSEAFHATLLNALTRECNFWPLLFACSKLIVNFQSSQGAPEWAPVLLHLIKCRVISLNIHPKPRKRVKGHLLVICLNSQKKLAFSWVEVRDLCKLC